MLLDGEPNIKLLVIDSISSFYYLNKYEEKEGIRYQRQISRTLKRLANAYTLLVFATKGTLFPPKQQEKDKDGIIQHREYLGVWDIVKYRLILSPSPSSKDHKKAPFIAKFASPQSMSTSNTTTTTNATPHQISFTSTLYKYFIDDTGLVIL